MNLSMKGNGAILLDLDGGLILRRATQEDAAALRDFNASVHSSEETGEPNDWVGTWAYDLLTKPHPTFHPADFTIVEDTHHGKIVSSLNLISQTWTFAGIEFKVGRPELVGTLPEYRGRGLVRAQFDVVHQWSAERSELVQAITGIPYYYRIFGYEMALNLGGGRAGFTPHIPALQSDQADPFRLRPATLSDIEFIADLYQQACKRSLVSCVRDREVWAYELAGSSTRNVNRSEVRIIEKPGGERVGYLAHPPYRWGMTLAATAYEILPGLSWSEVTPSVIRYLKATGEVYPTEEGQAPPFGSFGFWLGSEHPVYSILREKLPRVRKPYAWYLRVVDLPAFIQRISPILEIRLAASPQAGFGGELRISFYTNGISIKFDEGHIAEVAAWKPAPHGHSGDVAFPGLIFLQLLFGYRSFEELQFSFPDCISNNDMAVTLIEILFPKQASNIWPVS